MHPHSCLREACPHQNGWIFGKFPKGGSFLIQKKCNFFALNWGGVISDLKNFVANFFAFEWIPWEKTATFFFWKRGRGGGGQRPFLNFPEIHPFLRRWASLTLEALYFLPHWFVLIFHFDAFSLGGGEGRRWQGCFRNVVFVSSLSFYFVYNFHKTLLQYSFFSFCCILFGW